MSVTGTSATVQNTATPIEMLCINTIRTLSIDAVQAANSGHPGTPMAMAPLVYTLWQEFLRYDPADPLWPNRDRFVLSAGHASMVLYSILHLTGVREAGKDLKILDGPAVRLEDIKNFRQLGSRCPGHPESHVTTGVETTTGPLGQGYANSVGMAIAGKWLASRYNQSGFEDIYNYNVYALGGDGCMMEGVSAEAASLAGHLKLSNLCWIYDSNRITIEGGTPLAFTEDVAERFAAYGWNVTHVTDANDLNMIRAGFKTFLGTSDRPTLIIVNSHIGWGSPHRQDTTEAHGEALGEEEVKLTKRAYGWPEDAKFLIPDGVYQNFQKGIGTRGKADRDHWTARFGEYGDQAPGLADEITRMEHRQLPNGWDKELPSFPADAKGLATRDSSAKVENAIAQKCSVDDGWLRRSCSIHQDASHLRIGHRIPTGRIRFPEYAFRHSRTRHVRDRERHEPYQTAPVRRHVFRVHGLHARRHAAERDHGRSGDLHPDARFDRRGRRWADAPAHRAPGHRASHARHDDVAPSGRERSGGGVESGDAVAKRAGAAGSNTSGSAHAGPFAIAPAAGLARGAYVLAETAGTNPMCCCWPPAAKFPCALRRLNNWPRKAFTRASSACRPGNCLKSKTRHIAIPFFLPR